MADLNDINKPTTADNFPDVLDTLRENIKRVSAASMPITGGTFSGPISAASFTIMPGGYAVWHEGNLNQANFMPKSGGAFTGPVSLSGNATAPLHAVPLQQLTSSGFVPEAPNDGVYYARRNGSWQAAAPRFVDDPLIGIIAARPSHSPGSSSWLELNGQEVVKTSFPRLWAWIQANGQFATNLAAWNAGQFGCFLDVGPSVRLPFMGGTFIRTIDTSGSWYDIGRAPGTHQGEALMAHPHNVEGDTNVESADHGHLYQDGTPLTDQGLGPSIGAGGNRSGDVQRGSGGATAQHVHHMFFPTHVVGGPENRPANIAYRHYIYAGNPIA